MSETNKNLIPATGFETLPTETQANTEADSMASPSSQTTLRDVELMLEVITQEVESQKTPEQNSEKEDSQKTPAWNDYEDYEDWARRQTGMKAADEKDSEPMIEDVPGYLPPDSRETLSMQTIPHVIPASATTKILPQTTSRLTGEKAALLMLGMVSGGVLSLAGFTLGFVLKSELVKRAELAQCGSPPAATIAVRVATPNTPTPSPAPERPKLTEVTLPELKLPAKNQVPTREPAPRGFFLPRPRPLYVRTTFTLPKAGWRPVLSIAKKCGVNPTTLTFPLMDKGYSLESAPPAGTRITTICATSIATRHQAPTRIYF